MQLIYIFVICGVIWSKTVCGFNTRPFLFFSFSYSSFSRSQDIFAWEILCIENLSHNTSGPSFHSTSSAARSVLLSCIKVKFPHESWQVWNYDRKCFIPCHLPFIHYQLAHTQTHTHAYTHTHLHRSQPTGRSGSRFFNQSSRKIPDSLFMSV